MSAAAPTYNSIRVETPENISFDYELAGPATRMVAYFLDYLILNVTLSGITFILFAVTRAISSSEDLMLAIVIAIWAIFYIFGGYFILFELFNNGQTPGKKALGIRVIQTNGTALRLVPCLLRNIMRLIDCFFPFQFAIGATALTFSDHVQRFGDMLAGTIVIKENKQEKASKFRWKPRINRKGKGINLSLTRKEFDFISEYVSIYKDLSPEKRSILSSKVIQPIIQRNRLGSDPFFSPLIAQLNVEPELTRHLHAEPIMKELLQHYQEKDTKSSAQVNE